MMRSTGTALLLAAFSDRGAPFSVGRTLLIVFRWGIFLLACGFLYTQLSSTKGTATLDALSSAASWHELAFPFGLVVALMFLNWGLEAAKWRWLMRPVQRLSMADAFKATIAGTSVALVTPNRTGEFIGRVLFLDPAQRVRGAFATALGSMAQFVITLVMGGSALLAMLVLQVALPWPSGWMSDSLISLTALVAGGTLVLYFHPGLFRQLLLMVPFLKRSERASAVLNGFERHELLVVLLLSAARYLVFTAQFVLLLQVLHSGVSLQQAMLAVPVIYLVSTLIPTLLLTELGVRGSTAVALLAPLGGAVASVLLATFVLWLINLVMPAMAGSLILLLARIRTQQA
jgi:hypothetical protein